MHISLLFYKIFINIKNNPQNNELKCDKTTKVEELSSKYQLYLINFTSAAIIFFLQFHINYQI